MRSIITLLFTVFVFVISASYNSSVNSAFSQNDLANGFAERRLKPGASAASSERLVLMAENAGFVHNSSDNKYYISSRQRLWIQSKDKPDGGAAGVQKIEVKIDNGEYHEYYGNKTGMFSIEKEGPHTIVFRATDRLNNVEQPKVFEVVVDNTAPWIEVEYQTKAPFKYCVKSNVVYVPVDHQILVRAFDVGAGVQKVEVSQSGDAYQEVKSGDPIKASKSGWNVLRIKATDNVMNESSEYILNVFVDDIAPTIKITPKYALISESGEVVDSGSTSASKSVDTKPAVVKPADTKPADTKPATAPDTKAAPAGEDIPIEEIGQVSSREKGLLPGQSDKGGNRYSGVDNTYSITAYDKESGIALIEIRLDGSDKWDIYRKPIQFFTQGRHTIEVRATDCVGNQSTATLEVMVDNLPPESQIGSEAKSAVPSGGAAAKTTESGDKGTKPKDDGSDLITPRYEE